MNNVGLESFAYSKGESKFFKEIVDIIKKERQLGNKSASQILTSGLKEVITANTGLNIVKIEPTKGELAFAVLTSNLTGKDINTTRHYIDTLKNFVIENTDLYSIDNIERKNEWYGNIDLKKHRVSGIFSKLPNTLYVSVTDFYGDKYLPEEIAAVILHECGHALYGFVTLSHIVTFNVVFQSISEQLDKVEPEEYNFKLTDIANHLKLDKESLDAVKRSKTSKEGYNILITSVAEAIKSSTGTLEIDRTFNETYADTFAVRNGAGKYLFDALNKVFKSYGAGYRSMTYQNIRAVGTQLAVSLLVGTYVGLTAGVLLAIPFIGAIMMVIFTGGVIATGQGDGEVYEDPKERLTRIKMDVMGELKKPVSKERRTQLNEQLIAMNKTLAIINDDSISYLEFLKNFRSKYRKHVEEQNYQRTLQELAKHDLILASSIFKEMI